MALDAEAAIDEDLESMVLEPSQPLLGDRKKTKKMMLKEKRAKGKIVRSSSIGQAAQQSLECNTTEYTEEVDCAPADWPSFADKLTPEPADDTNLPQDPPEVNAFLPEPRASSPIPRTPVAARLSYSELRPQLFQDAFFQSVSGAQFNDTYIHVFCARTKSGVAHKPRIVHARSAFLEAASAQFEEEIYRSCTVKSQGDARSSCSRVDYGYDDDSDLEDLEEELVSYSTSDDIDTSGKTAVQAKDILSIPYHEGVLKGTSASDSELLSLDGSDDGFSDLSVEEANDSYEQRMEEPRMEEPRTVVCTPSLTGLTLQNACVGINEEYNTIEMPTVSLDDFEKQDPGSPLPVKEFANTLHKAKATIEVDTNTRDRILVIPDSAHKTWQALLLYLYNDSLCFALLKSERRPARPDFSSRPQCSPKSMYRLADKLGLLDLKQSTLEAIRKSLSKDNIIAELFSDFTWRYPEVLQMEIDVFNGHSSELIVQTDLSKTFHDIAAGLYPHSAIILDSMFKKLDCRPQGTAKC